MIIERSMSDGWLSNSYLVADRPGGHGVLIDSGGPLEPILEAIASNDITITHLLLTHHHVDHIVHNAEYVERFGCEIWGHPAERPYCDDIQHDLEDGDEIVSGDLRIRALLTPGHTVGMLALVVNDEAVFTGDTLFKGTVGGTLAPGHATYADLKRMRQRSVRSGRPTRSSASGAASTPRATRPAPHSIARPPSWSGLWTTTGAPSAGFASRTPARTRSLLARKSPATDSGPA